MIYEIEIKNWEKYQHQNGSRTYEWFKISSNILDDAEIQSLTHLQFRIWIHLLALCAKFRSGTVKVTLTYLRSNPNVPLKYIERAINRFQQYQWIIIKNGTNQVPQNRIEENRREKKEYSVRAGSHKPATKSGISSDRVKRFVGAFVTAFQGRYQVRPDLNDPRLCGQLKKFAETYQDIDRACAMIQVFFQMQDPWFETKEFDFTTFTNNINKVALALDRGHETTRSGLEQWAQKNSKEVACTVK